MDTGEEVRRCPIPLADEIAELPKMTRAQLQAKWRSALKQAPPPHLEKPLLVPLLAYKLQEQAYGGLKPVTNADCANSRTALTEAQEKDRRQHFPLWGSNRERG